MKTTLLIAASLLLAACASVDTSITGAPRAVAGGSAHTYYCWKEKLDTQGGDLVCNWEASAAEACRSTSLMTIARSNVANGPDNTRRCENGEWLVVVTTK